ETRPGAGPDRGIHSAREVREVRESEGDVYLGSRHRCSQLAEEYAGAVGGVADRRGGDRESGHRLARLVPDAHADGADAGFRLLDVLRIALVTDPAELAYQGAALGHGHALGRAAVRPAE